MAKRQGNHYNLNLRDGYYPAKKAKSVFDFKFDLPLHCPSSFEFHHSSIKYLITASIQLKHSSSCDTIFKTKEIDVIQSVYPLLLKSKSKSTLLLNNGFKSAFTMDNSFDHALKSRNESTTTDTESDINLNTSIINPLKSRVEVQNSCKILFGGDQPVTLTGTIDSPFITSGTNICIKVTVNNATKKKLQGLKIQFQKKLIMINPTADTTDLKVITEIIQSTFYKDHIYDPKDFRTALVHVTVPPEIYTIKNTNLAEISYSVLVSLITPGLLTKDLVVDLPVDIYHPRATQPLIGSRHWVNAQYDVDHLGINHDYDNINRDYYGHVDESKGLPEPTLPNTDCIDLEVNCGVKRGSEVGLMGLVDPIVSGSHGLLHPQGAGSQSLLYPRNGEQVPRVSSSYTTVLPLHGSVLPALSNIDALGLDILNGNGIPIQSRRSHKRRESLALPTIPGMGVDLSNGPVGRRNSLDDRRGEVLPHSLVLPKVPNMGINMDSGIPAAGGRRNSLAARRSGTLPPSWELPPKLLNTDGMGFDIDNFRDIPMASLKSTDLQPPAALSNIEDFMINVGDSFSGIPAPRDSIDSLSLKRTMDISAPMDSQPVSAPALQKLRFDIPVKPPSVPYRNSHEHFNCRRVEVTGESVLTKFDELDIEIPDAPPSLPYRNSSEHFNCRRVEVFPPSTRSSLNMELSNPLSAFNTISSRGLPPRPKVVVPVSPESPKRDALEEPSTLGYMLDTALGFLDLNSRPNTVETTTSKRRAEDPKSDEDQELYIRQEDINRDLNLPVKYNQNSYNYRKSKTTLRRKPLPKPTPQPKMPPQMVDCFFDEDEDRTRTIRKPRVYGVVESDEEKAFWT